MRAAQAFVTLASHSSLRTTPSPPHIPRATREHGKWTPNRRMAHCLDASYPRHVEGGSHITAAMVVWAARAATQRRCLCARAYLAAYHACLPLRTGIMRAATRGGQRLAAPTTATAIGAARLSRRHGGGTQTSSRPLCHCYICRGAGGEKSTRLPSPPALYLTP